MNTFGQLFRVTTFGESHGVALGAVIDGCPAGVSLSAAHIQEALNRRRPAQSQITTARDEADAVEILSGIYEGKTLGTPIAAVVRNTDARSQDYDDEARPGHADAVWRQRFRHLDPRGGGRTSGRETLCRVIGAAVAEALLARDVPMLVTVGWVSQVGSLVAPAPTFGLSRIQVDAHPTRCPDAHMANAFEKAILQAKAAGDSLGGAIQVRVEGVPSGLGEPVFGKLKARLADALAGIGAVTGVTWGPDDLDERLTQLGTAFHMPRADERPGEVYGGIQGGLSNGETMQLRVFFKPPATLGAKATRGRHDACILPRAVPVVEAMVSLVLADVWLLFLSRAHRP